MFGRKAKRIQELEEELEAQKLKATVFGSRYSSVKIALDAEREIYGASIRRIEIADLQKVFDALTRYRQVMAENFLPDPYQEELCAVYKKYGLNFNPTNRMNSPV